MHYIIRHKMCIFRILLVCFYLLVVLGVILVANAHAQKKLGFASANSSFRIAIFADLHYGENAWTDWGPLQDQKSSKVMSTVLDTESPDFVVYLGDVVTANNLPIRNATKYWEQAISPTKSRNIPWASVFGNHDDMAFEWPDEWFGSLGLPSIQCPDSSLATGVEQVTDCYFQGTSRVDILKMDAQQSLSRSSFGPKSLWPSVSNYYLEVASYKYSKSPAALLYFLDSGGGSYPEVISKNQAKWFQQTAAQKNPNSSENKQNSYKRGLLLWIAGFRKLSFGIFLVKPIKKLPLVLAPPIKDPCVGSINLERVDSQTAEWGIMDILTNRTSVKAVFVGHNHGLDWCCPHKNLWLCFARHTGYGGYGSWPRGARILELVERNSELKSWIRMEDGTTHSHMTITSA